LFLLMGGAFRIVAALVGRLEHRGWLLLNGVITLLMGILIWRQWPWSGLWVIGLFVGIEMIFYGWSLVMLTAWRPETCRRLPRPKVQHLRNLTKNFKATYSDRCVERSSPCFLIVPLPPWPSWVSLRWL